MEHLQVNLQEQTQISRALTSQTYECLVKSFLDHINLKQTKHVPFYLQSVT